MSQYPNLDACDPRQCISSRMLKCSRIISGIFRKHLLPFNITNSQLSILFILSKKGGTSQQDLANMLYLEKSTISRNVKRLLDGTLIKKENTKIIAITNQGKAFLENVIPAWDKAMEEAKIRLTEEGDAALTVLLDHLKQ